MRREDYVIRNAMWLSKGYSSSAKGLQRLIGGFHTGLERLHERQLLDEFRSRKKGTGLLLQQEITPCRPLTCDFLSCLHSLSPFSSTSEVGLPVVLPPFVPPVVSVLALLSLCTVSKRLRPSPSMSPGRLPVLVPLKESLCVCLLKRVGGSSVGSGSAAFARLIWGASPVSSLGRFFTRTLEEVVEDIEGRMQPLFWRVLAGVQGQRIPGCRVRCQGSPRRPRCLACS